MVRQSAAQAVNRVAGAADRTWPAILGALTDGRNLTPDDAAWAMDETWERMEPELGFYDS